MTGVEFHEHLIDVGYEIPTILELPTPTKRLSLACGRRDPRVFAFIRVSPFLLTPTEASALRSFSTEKAIPKGLLSFYNLPAAFGSLP